MNFAPAGAFVKAKHFSSLPTFALILTSILDDSMIVEIIVAFDGGRLIVLQFERFQILTKICPEVVAFEGEFNGGD